MKLIYECEHCGKQFSNQTCCAWHEILHLKDVEKIKYYIMNMTDEDLCRCCVNSFYVYGCELSCLYSDCNRHNNYKDFRPYDVEHYSF